MTGEQPPNLPKRDEGHKDERLASFGPRKPAPPAPQPEPAVEPEITKDQATGRAGIETYLARQAAEEQRIRDLTPNQIKNYEVQFYFKFKRKPDSRADLIAWIKTLNPVEPE